MVLAPLNCLKQTISAAVVVRDTLERLHDPDGLPGVLDAEHVEQQVEEGSELVGVGECNLPEQLVEDSVTELRILPATELQQPPRVLALVTLLDQLLEVSIPVEQEIRDLGLEWHDVVVVERRVQVGVGQGRLSLH